MDLLERYLKSPDTTYVGKVRTTQVGVDSSGKDITSLKRGVNFFDGVGRAPGNPAPDEYQTEFQRNAPGDFRYGAGDKVPAGTNDKSYPLSRWLSTALDKAFGPTGYITNTRFTTIGDVRNAPNTLVHKYAPLPGREFKQSPILSQLSKSKIIGSPSGPAPSGLQG